MTLDGKTNLERRKSKVERVRRRLPSNATSATTSTGPGPVPTRASCSGEQVRRQALPPWDRTVDVVYHKRKHTEKRSSPAAAAFESSLNRFTSERRRKGCPRKIEVPEKSSLLSSLPATTRFLIFQHVVAAHRVSTKPITLNRACFNRDCWEQTDFITLEDALKPLWPYMSVSYGFYTDVLLTFLSENTFHATFSPFVNSRLNPLSTTWLNKYGMFMRSIIIEVDMTRLGLGPGLSAARLLPGLEQMEGLLRDFSLTQATRGKATPLESLILLCRRFYGRRGSQDVPESRASQAGQSSRASSHSIRSQKSEAASSIEEASGISVSGQSDDTRATSPDSDGPGHAKKLSSLAGVSNIRTSISCDQQNFLHCPDTHLLICNHILRLRGLVDSIRMCGFSELYTHQFITTLFPSARNHPAREHSYRVAPSAVWPRLPAQRSWLDAGNSLLFLDDHDTPNQDVEGIHWTMLPEGPVQLPPPIIESNGMLSLPRYASQGQTQATKRRSTVSSGASFPDRRRSILVYGQDAGSLNSLKHTRSDERSKIQRLLERYGGAGRVKAKKGTTAQANTTA